MNPRIRFAFALIALALGLSVSRAQTPASPGETDPNADFSAELPRIPPTEPADALATFRLHEGFAIEQVAAEPLVYSPVAISFDERGRLYVVEMRDYSEDDSGLHGRVRRLVDTDEDGRFDESTVFLEDLSWPTGVICYGGGVFVAAAPHIYFAKDDDGDGKADQTEIAFTGFGRSNVQGLLNSLNWGLDNRIHGATSSSGGQVVRPDVPDMKPVDLNGRDFAFDPRTRELVATSGGAQHGLSFDRWGRKFVCSNSDHIQLVMYEDRYLARNPALAAPGPRVSIAADGPQAEVFRTSPVEPWRIVRTRLRVAGAVPGPIEGGGRAAGYFTGATGTTIYKGDAWPAEYLDQSFTGDVGSNIVHRKILTPNGVGLIANRADEGVEFLSSTDNWFRPAQFANAPDGALYICDVYREVIEHPASLPPPIKKHLDLNNGNDRGRVYRIVPDGFVQRPLPRLDEATTEELVATLGHANGWHRDTAARLLYERQDPAAIGPLQTLVAECDLPEGRMHALCALAGLDALDERTLFVGLADRHPWVLVHAVRLWEMYATDDGGRHWRLYQLVELGDPVVRYQVAFTLGELAATSQETSPRDTSLARLAALDGDDPWMRMAILSSSAGRAENVFHALLRDRYRSRPGGGTMLEELAALIASGREPADSARLIASIRALPAKDSDLAQRIVRGLGRGLGKSGPAVREALVAMSPENGGELLDNMLAAAREAASDESLPPPARAESIRTLTLGTLGDSEDLLTTALDNRQPQEIQLAALEALGRFADPQVAQIVVAAWPAFSPRLRSEASEVLFGRPERLLVLLDAIESEQVRANDLDPARIKLLLAHPDSAIQTRSAVLFAEVKLARRQEVVDAYLPALELQGDAVRGKQAFLKVCAACHKLDGAGHEIGPNLATFTSRGPEAILLNVLDPNREVNPLYVNYVVETTDGLTLTGLVAAETGTSVTLRRAEGAGDTVLRANIAAMQSTGLSIMPEGVEKDIDRQTLADLLAYLATVR